MPNVPIVAFGPGKLIVRALGILNPTPYNIGYAQSFSYDEAGDTKQLHGQDQYALAAARGTIKASGKIVAATIYGQALNAVFNGQSFAAGQLLRKNGEEHTIPATPFQITLVPPASGVFDMDQGIYFKVGNGQLTAVASAPATGQYVVDETTGEYTFAAADTGKVVKFDYAYTVATGGQIITIENTEIGDSPFFQMDYATVFKGRSYYMRVFSAIASKLTRSHKLTDFVMPEIDFESFADDSGRVYTASYGDPV